MSARLVDGRVEVRIPVDLPPAEERRFVERMLRRFRARAARQEATSAEDLHARATALSRRYFDGRLAPESVEYVANQRTLFGSCSARTRRIRLSHRLATLPAWVRDYVLVHELAHLEEPNHSSRFWRLVNRYPLAERARGYLMAVGLEPASDNT
jgi:hypothetical protein